MEIIGASFGKGQGKDGVERSLDVLLENGLEELFLAPEIRNVFHYYNESVENYLIRLYHIIKKAHKKGQFVLNIGGDHSVAISTVYAAVSQFNDLSLIWVDNHADFNDVNSTVSGNLHGMPLNCIVNGKKTFNGYEYLWTANGCINPKNIVLIGINDVDEQEKVLLENSGIHVYWLKDVQTRGIDVILGEALKILDSKNLHLSFDVDAIVHQEFKATGCYTNDGISLNEAKYIIKSLKNTNKLRSMDLVEYNPLLDFNNNHHTICLDILKNLV